MMADDERRAEIEAEAVDVVAEFLHTGGPSLNADQAAIEIVGVLSRAGLLDRVRDARGDDHGPTFADWKRAARSPQDEDHECIYESDADGDLACPVCGRYADSGDEAADAQDEDHETGETDDERRP